MRIVLESVLVQYDRALPSARTALRDVDVTFETGRTVAIMGPTGSGKTSLLEVAAGLRDPDSGSAWLDGGDDTGLRSSVGLVYQFPEAQFFEETVEDDVAFGPRRMGIDDDGVRRRVSRSLSRAGLDPEEFGPRSPLSLSAGEKRRAAIACILALERPFLLLDEPTAGLDPASRRRVLKLVEAEKAEGRGVVIVTHDPEIADGLAERVVVIADGEIAADGGPDRVFGNGSLLDAVGLAPPAAYDLVRMIAGRSRERARAVAQVLGVSPPAADGTD